MENVENVLEAVEQLLDILRADGGTLTEQDYQNVNRLLSDIPDKPFVDVLNRLGQFIDRSAIAKYGLSNEDVGLISVVMANALTRIPFGLDVYNYPYDTVADVVDGATALLLERTSTLSVLGHSATKNLVAMGNSDSSEITLHVLLFAAKLMKYFVTVEPPA